MLEEKIKNIKSSLISFFKNPKEVLRFFLPIILVICLLIPVPYYIKLGGGTIPVDNKIKIEGETKYNGSFNALYVSEIKGNVFLYLLSYIVPSFEKVKEEKVVLDNEKTKDYDYREKIYFTNSTDTATKVAYDKALKKVEVKTSDFVVLYIDKKAKTNISVGDKILKVEDKKIKEYKDITDIINSKKENDRVNILVKRDHKEMSTTSQIIKINNEPKLGIAISNAITYKTDPKVSFDFSKSQTGPSGGLMIALSIYNKLTEKDITNGKKIMGTGTISLDGSVGMVGGIKQKLKGANSKKADIVLVPEGNHKEALKVKKENNYNFELISVKSFNDALEKLGNK